MSNVGNKLNILIFITGGFPFGKGETFIENEIHELSSFFDKIVIISHDVKSNEKRPIPENVFIDRINYESNFYEKILSLLSFFSMQFWKEIYLIIFGYKKSLSFGIIKLPSL